MNAVLAAVVEVAQSQFIEETWLFVVDVAEHREGDCDDDAQRFGDLDGERSSQSDAREYVIFVLPSFDPHHVTYVSVGLRSAIEILVSCQFGEGPPNATVVLHRIAERIVFDGRFESDDAGEERLIEFVRPPRREPIDLS